MRCKCLVRHRLHTVASTGRQRDDFDAFSAHGVAAMLSVREYRLITFSSERKEFRFSISLQLGKGCAHQRKGLIVRLKRAVVAVELDAHEVSLISIIRVAASDKGQGAFREVVHIALIVIVVEAVLVLRASVDVVIALHADCTRAQGCPLGFELAVTAVIPTKEVRHPALDKRFEHKHGSVQFSLGYPVAGRLSVISEYYRTVPFSLTSRRVEGRKCAGSCVIGKGRRSAGS